MPSHPGWQGSVPDLADALALLFDNGALHYEKFEDETPDVKWITANTPGLKKLWEIVPFGNCQFASFRNAVLRLMGPEKGSLPRYPHPPRNRKLRFQEAGEQADMLRSICKHIRLQWYRRTSCSKPLAAWMDPFPVPPHFNKKKKEKGAQQAMPAAPNEPASVIRSGAAALVTDDQLAGHTDELASAERAARLWAGAAPDETASVIRSGAAALVRPMMRMVVTDDTADTAEPASAQHPMIAFHRGNWEMEALCGSDHEDDAEMVEATPPPVEVVDLEADDEADDDDDDDDDSLDDEEDVDREVVTIYGCDVIKDDDGAVREHKAWRMLVDVSSTQRIGTYKYLKNQKSISHH